MPRSGFRYLIGIALTATACGGDRPESSRDAAVARRNGPTLTGAGATFPAPLYTKWFDVFARETGVRINYQSIGSGGGIRQFVEGTVDFGATDGPMTDAQIAAVQRNVLHVPTVLGAVSVTYNLPGLAGRPLAFDGRVLADIFRGRITRWNDRRVVELNPGVGLPPDDIMVVHRSDGSGTTFIFTDYLSKVSPEWNDQVGRGTSVNWPVGLGGKGNEGVTQQIKQSPGTIGYVELIYAISNDLPSASVRNSAGTLVQPTLKSVAAAAGGAKLEPGNDFRVSITNAAGLDSYPISSFTWLLVRKQDPDSSRSRTLASFLKWMLEPSAQRLAAELHYAPLPAPVIELVRKEVLN
jgi:phosphate transport system substrate-binding protein